MKGQAILISYVLVVLLSLILITFSSFLFFSFYSNLSKDWITKDLESISLKLYNYIITAYELANKSKFLPKSNSCVLLQEIELNFPSKVSGKNYEIWVKSLDKNFEIEAKADSEVINKKLPKVEVEVEGKLDSESKKSMYYYRCNLNRIKDKIVFGGS
ncbi:MAG: hypothetical protein NZ942_02680 [Candidatus Aenigmarchaeota archaeon]|nr:hypothetical protein [Candidatus Aenigmarchaeota archaeon]